MPQSWTMLRLHCGWRSANGEKQLYVCMYIRGTWPWAAHSHFPFCIGITQVAEQESIEKHTQEIQRSLDAMTQSLERLSMDVEGSLGKLDELGRGLHRVRELKEAISGCMQVLEKVEAANKILVDASDGRRGAGGRVSEDVARDGQGKVSRRKDVIDGELYHAAKLFAGCVREVKARHSRQLVTVRGLEDAVQSLKPLLDDRVMRLVTGFLESADAERLAEIGRDAMSGVVIPSGRYYVDPLSYAVVVTRAYDPVHVARVRELYVEHREQQLGRLLGSLSSESLNLEPLVGFFLMEIEVSRVMETGAFLRDMWDGVGAAIGAEVGAALDESDGWEEMLELKRDVIRACQAFVTAGDSLDTTPLTSSVMKRSARYERLVSAVVVTELEMSGEDVIKIDEAVRGCCSKVGAYVEGLVGDTDREVDVARSKVDAVLGDILERALNDISVEDAASDPDASISGLLSLVETTYCIITSLEGVYSSRDGLTTLLRLMDAGGRRAAEFLANKAFEDAKIIRKTDGDDEEGLLSSWCDALIEQFEFSREELDEYGFGGDVGRAIAGWYAENLCQLIETQMRHVAAKDMAALRESLRV